MWKKILRYFAIINMSRFATASKKTTGTAGIIIEEVCVPHQITELERYLDEFDLPEVPISNTATYPYLGIDDGAVAELGKLPPESLAVKEIESMPLGALPMDWKRLRILYDLLILPEDGELKSKLSILYRILIAANQRARKTQKIEEEKNTPNYFGDERIDSSGSERSNSLTTSRQRSERSTYEQNFGHTDSSNPNFGKEDRASSSSPRMETPLDSEGFSEPPETLDFGRENLARDAEIGGKSSPESNTVIPQIKMVEEIFKDSESGGGTEEYSHEVTKAENRERKNTDSGLEETGTDSNLKKMNADSNFEAAVTDSNFKRTITDSKVEESFTDSNLKATNTDSTPKSTATDSNFEVAVTDSNLKETIIDSNFEKSFTNPNLRDTNTDSTPKSTVTASNFKATAADSNLRETIIDSNFEKSFTDSSLREINTDSTPKSTVTASNFEATVTDSNLKEIIIDLNFEKSFTDSNLGDTNTDSTPKSTVTASNFEVTVADSNLKETIIDSNFEKSFTDSNLREINTDSTPKSTVTASNFEATVTDSNLKETIIDSNFEKSFTGSNLREINTDSTPKSTVTASNFEVTVTDSNTKETIADSKFEESFADPNSRETSTSLNSEEAVTDSASKRTVTDLESINTVTDSNLRETVADTNSKESITGSNLIKMVTEYPTWKLNDIESSTVGNLHSKEPEHELIKGEDHEADCGAAKVTDFENRKSSEHVASETINEMRSPGPEGEVTTEEIKPDVRSEDLETRITTLSDPFIRSSSLLPMDQKTPRRYFAGESSPPRYFTTPSYRGDKGSKISLNYERGSDNPASESPDNKDLAPSPTTRKTLILNIAESFSNVPRPVEVALFKKKGQKSGNHISRMRSYEDEKNSRILNPPGFYQKRGNRAGQESGGKLSGFGYFRRPNSTGRHVKRGGHNTDVEKLYRWFYRGGEIPGEPSPGGPEVRCDRES